MKNIILKNIKKINIFINVKLDFWKKNYFNITKLKYIWQRVKIQLKINWNKTIINTKNINDLRNNYKKLYEIFMNFGLLNTSSLNEISCSSDNDVIINCIPYQLFYELSLLFFLYKFIGNYLQSFINIWYKIGNKLAIPLDQIHNHIYLMDNFYVLNVKSKIKFTIYIYVLYIIVLMWSIILGWLVIIFMLTNSRKTYVFIMEMIYHYKNFPDKNRVQTPVKKTIEILIIRIITLCFFIYSALGMLTIFILVKSIRILYLQLKFLWDVRFKKASFTKKLLCIWQATICEVGKGIQENLADRGNYFSMLIEKIYQMPFKRPEYHYNKPKPFSISKRTMFTSRSKFYISNTINQLNNQQWGVLDSFIPENNWLFDNEINNFLMNEKIFTASVLNEVGLTNKYKLRGKNSDDLINDAREQTHEIILNKNPSLPHEELPRTLKIFDILKENGSSSNSFSNELNAKVVLSQHGFFDPNLKQINKDLVISDNIRYGLTSNPGSLQIDFQLSKIDITKHSISTENNFQLKCRQNDNPYCIPIPSIEELTTILNKYNKSITIVIDLSNSNSSLQNEFFLTLFQSQNDIILKALRERSLIFVTDSIFNYQNPNIVPKMGGIIQSNIPIISHINPFSVGLDGQKEGIVALQPFINPLDFLLFMENFPQIIHKTPLILNNK